MANDYKPLLPKDEVDFSSRESLSDSSSDQEYHESRVEGRYLRVSRPRGILILIFVFLSILANVLLVSLHFLGVKEVQENCQEVSPITGLQSKAITTPMIHDTPYDDPKLNGTLQSELWNLIDADRGIILMDQEHIDELGLDDSQSFPWDPSKKVYLVNAYHQLHCLKILYWTVTNAYEGAPLTVPHWHLLHCLETLRQDVVCYADDELLYTTAKSASFIGDGHLRQCRDFSKLEEWVMKPGRNACYTTHPVENSSDHLMHWRHCPRDSPYFQQMRDHFGYSEDWEPDYDIYTGPAVVEI